MTTASWYPSDADRPLIRQNGGVWRPTKVWLADDDGEDGDESVRFATPAELSGTLYTWGWRIVENTDGLLDAFARIATSRDVEQFASQRGPLWLCKTHYSPRIGSLCLVGAMPQQVVGWRWLDGANCAWQPSEPVSAWITEARRVRGALAVIQALQRDPPASAQADAWRDLGFTDDQAAELASDNQLFEARYQISVLINTYLVTDPRGPRLALQEDLQLRFDLGLGALRAVWLLLAQAAARQRAIYLCTGCGALYVRRFDLRRPRSGQGNYCDDCRANGQYLVAKRLSKARRRT